MQNSEGNTCQKHMQTDTHRLYVLAVSVLIAKHLEAILSNPRKGENLRSAGFSADSVSMRGSYFIKLDQVQSTYSHIFMDFMTNKSAFKSRRGCLIELQ